MLQCRSRVRRDSKRCYSSFPPLISNTSQCKACSCVIWCVHDCTVLYILWRSSVSSLFSFTFVRRDLATSLLPWKWRIIITFKVEVLIMCIWIGSFLSVYKGLAKYFIFIISAPSSNCRITGTSENNDDGNEISKRLQRLTFSCRGTMKCSVKIPAVWGDGENRETLSSWPFVSRQTTLPQMIVFKWRVKSYPNYRLVWKNSIQPALCRGLE